MAHNMTAIQEIEYFDALMAVPFTGTRCADEVFLGNLGILEDVRIIFNNMGLGELPFMTETSFQSITCEFLASLTLHINPSPINIHDIGHIKFCAQDQIHEMSLRTLAALFDLQEGTETDLFQTKFSNLGDVWATISGEQYVPGANKASSIRHPAIRYAHNYLAQTFYSRTDDTTVEEPEVVLLAMGLKPLVRRCMNSNKIEGDGTNVHMAAILARQLMELREEAVQNNLPHLNVGSFVTSILKRCGLFVPSMKKELPRFIDETVLPLSRRMVGSSMRYYIYSFQLMPNFDGQIILPDKAVTDLTKRGNVNFLPFDRLLSNGE